MTERSHLLPGKMTEQFEEEQAVHTVPKVGKFRRSLSYQGPHIWTNLPESCKRNHHLLAFKRNLRKHMWSLFMDRGTVR